MAPAWSRISAATSSSCGGLWQRTTTSTCSASSALEAATVPPTASASAPALSASMSATTTCSFQPRASAPAMFPAPMSPIFTAGAYLRLRLVEEALLDQPRAFFRRDLDVARREKEDLVGDALHSAVERVGQARGEVDQALRE